MEKKENTAVITVPHIERPASLELKISGIPPWKQDVFNLVAELTKYRLRNKITQQELANRLQVKQSVIARFEKLGRFPTIEFLYKVAAGLGMQIDISIRGLEAVITEMKPIEKIIITPKGMSSRANSGS
ncbi:MAG: helix-turn-helix transcriptional regulator [Candidatus Cloacimonas sp.]|jgi:predicted transcriptional regulator|nr:helix-turn-helix transcriptional regulator [Candidatus Cloacimonas sp.]